MAADLLIYALVAAGLVFWLRNILGTRTGDERERPNPFTSRPENNNNPNNGPIPAGQADDSITAMPGILPGYQEQMAETLDRNMSIATPAAEQGLMDIARADRDFSVPHFLRGSQDAFVMIVEAFAARDRDTLRDLLSPAVYDGFDRVLAEREKQNQTASVEIHAVRKIEVLEAYTEKKTAFIVVRFVADETSLLRDADGHYLMGHPDRVTETIDIWTFARPVNSRSPAWLVHETREGTGDEQSGSTVPESDIIA